MPKNCYLLYTDEMARAWVEGRKTQTRRLVKPQPIGQAFEPGVLSELGTPYRVLETTPGVNTSEKVLLSRARYQAGDIMVAKESAMLLFQPSYMGIKYRADDAIFDAPHDWDDDDPVLARWTAWQKAHPGEWRNKQCLPERACRTRRLIEAVRIERLHDITEADAVAEGIELVQPPSGQRFALYRNYLPGYSDDRLAVPARFSYETLWRSIHGRGSWGANPWVYVIVCNPKPL